MGGIQHRVVDAPSGGHGMINASIRTDLPEDLGASRSSSDGHSWTHPRRFTLDGGKALEDHLAKTCQWISAGVRGLIPARKLEAVLLGGGYGRGEGGVLETPEGQKPYNDLEFYVFVTRPLNEFLYHRQLEVLGEILTPLAGLEVEFKITSLAELERSPVSMFSYDLVMGHRWTIGNEELLSRCGHHRVAAGIPASEATRLLMNRCSGLLFARERLEREIFSPADADFVQRNIAKMELALGDALLAAHGLYHWSCRERHRRLQECAPPASLPWLEEVRVCHGTGVEFKLHPRPDAIPRPELQNHHARISALAKQVWLWLEGCRLNATFSTARDYALFPSKCPETNVGRNLLVNLRHFGPRALLRKGRTTHLRERVLGAMAMLLWESPRLTEATNLQWVQAQLNTSAFDFRSLVDSYQHLWRKAR
jgi:hypothetical protein